MTSIFISWAIVCSWLGGFGEASAPEDGHLYLDDGWIVKLPKIGRRELILSPEGLTSAADELVIQNL